MISNLPLNYTSGPTVNDASLVDADLDNANSTTQTNATTGEPLYDPNDVAPSSNGTDLPYGLDNITDPAYFQGPTWCFLESQDWTGVEVEPDCSDASNVFCADPDSMNRMVLPRLPVIVVTMLTIDSRLTYIMILS
jgi:hypothetical protein